MKDQRYRSETAESRSGRQAALLNPRKIRENLYQVHLLVVLSGIFNTIPAALNWLHCRLKD